MIRFAKEQDKDALLELCIKSLPLKEKHFLEYYFAHQFEGSNVLISELDHLLVSQIHKREHILCFHKKQLEVAYLFGITTHYDYRRRGIMRDLMDMVLSDCAKNYLITFLEASNPKLFERYGFDVISTRKRYVVYAKELVKYSTKGVTNEFNADDLAQVYRQFAKVFDCYYDRDESYYQHMIEKTKYDGGKICVYKDHEQKMKGYVLYYELDDGIEVKEILYQDSKSLCALLRYAIGYNPFISIEVSQAEHLEKIFKMSIPRSFPCVMARINNLKLFNKLFNTHCKSAKDMIKMLDKPILINEKY
ncbi:MAG: GNAT family N-acetyltransferase [Erysipelotrichia bacterium]|nr:GNAT family N-acetyltransferase [Erysipelotrichia bacterium]NCC55213.1 GNAT family N-acetyltransferase [Erysipelotrichia bacterium]